MRIAVEGCAHGELEIIYDALQEVEKSDGKKIDLLICCGDFQSTRNLTDLSCMAVPDKYKDMCSFYKYYSGEKVAPVLTIFIGGNHEASNYLQELPYGGWAAPNIYYMGYANVVSVAGIRIAGISGIYKSQDWMQGHHEAPPYNNSTIRSVYHIRNLEVFRLKQISGNIDIFLSHDWPRGITQYGDEQGLLRIKPFFKEDIEANALGSPPCMELLLHHYPTYWFSAHLHCKFAALVPEESSKKLTKFLALDKCLPKRKFLQIVELPHDEKLPIKISYDLEWLTILYLTNHLLSVKSGTHYMPGKGGDGRSEYTPTILEKENISKKFGADLQIPENFVQTSKAYKPETPRGSIEPARLLVNPQTTNFCDKLGIDDPSALLQIMTNSKDSLNNSGHGDKSSDSRNASLTFDDDNVMNSTVDEDSPDDSIYQSSAAIENLPEDSIHKKINFPIENSSEDSIHKKINFPIEKSSEDSIHKKINFPIENSPEDSIYKKINFPVENSSEDSIHKKINFPVENSSEDSIDRLKSEEIDDEIKEENSDISELNSIEASNEKEGEIILPEPNCKKFKRRNHSLYSDNV